MTQINDPLLIIRYRRYSLNKRKQILITTREQGETGRRRRLGEILDIYSPRHLIISPTPHKLGLQCAATS